MEQVLTTFHVPGAVLDAGAGGNIAEMGELQRAYYS